MTKFRLLFALFFLMSFAVSAQTRIGIRGGLQLADMRSKPDDRSGLTDETKMLFGYQVGVVLDYSFNDILFFQPGLLINSKGSKVIFKDNLLNTTTTFKNNPIYAELPLMFGVRIGLENFKLFGMAGPYLAYGFAGKNSFKFESPIPALNTESEGSIKWGDETSLSDPRDLRRFDMGLSVAAGVELGNMQIGAFYNPGFVNISPEGSGGKLYNTTIGIQTTLLFGSKD
ncbi:MAG: porin family protein [Raineya sp.]